MAEYLSVLALKKKKMVNEEPAIRISSILLGQYSQDNTKYFFPFFFF